MSLEEEIDALYAVAPGEFIAARKALSVRRKKEGDAAGAARVAELAKPTLAAWTVNQLHREAVGELEGLLAIGATLRRAHRQGAGGVRDVFAAQQAQRAAVDGLTRTARTILEKAGSPATDATLARVGETLVSISTLNRWGDGEPGRLSRELSPPGFDALFEMLEVLEPGDDAALTHSGAARAPTRKNEPAERPAKGSKEKDESRATHEARRKALVDARRAAEAEVADAAQDKERAETRLHEARRTADGAELAAKEAEVEARRLVKEVRTAEEALLRAKREANDAATEASASADRAEAARASADQAARAKETAAARLSRAGGHLEAARRAEAVP